MIHAIMSLFVASTRNSMTGGGLLSRSARSGCCSRLNKMVIGSTSTSTITTGRGISISTAHQATATQTQMSRLVLHTNKSAISRRVNIVRSFGNTTSALNLSQSTNNGTPIFWNSQSWQGRAKRTLRSTALWTCLGPILMATTGISTTQCDNNNDNDDNEDSLTARIQRAIEETVQGGDGDDDDKDGFELDMDALAKAVGDRADDMIHTGIPGQLTGGFVAGWCAGFSLKKVGKAGAFVVGMGFCVLQSLSYAGYVHVNYNKMCSDALEVLDLNQDGKVDTVDVQRLHHKLMEVLTYNVPAGSGFGGGFFAGVRSG
jgi:uncharacterized membrane protein (Fun14 family)